MIARLWVRLSAFLLSALPTLVLTIGLVGMLSYSVDQAGWVKDSRPISNLMISGLIIGWLLAASRLRGWLALLYSLLIGMAGVIQELAQVSPELVRFPAHSLWSAGGWDAPAPGHLPAASFGLVGNA